VSDVTGCERACVPAISQHDNPIGQVHYFGEAMRDIDDAYAIVSQLPSYLK
jgi:hypothetical protein